MDREKPENYYLYFDHPKQINVTNNLTKAITFAAAGAIAGVIAGILFAPDKGKETRRKIAEGSRKLGDNIRNNFHKGRERIQEIEEDIAQLVH